MSHGTVDKAGVTRNAGTNPKGFFKKFRLLRTKKQKHSEPIEEEDTASGEEDGLPADLPVDHFTTKRALTRRVTFAGLTEITDDGDQPENLTENKVSNTTHGHKPAKRLTITLNDGNSKRETDTSENTIWKYPADETKRNNCFVSTFGKQGKHIGEYQDAKDVTLLSRGRLLITDMINSRLQLCNSTGRAMLIYHGDDFIEPWASAVTTDDNIAVTCSRRGCVIVLNADGDIIKIFGKHFFNTPTGIAVDADGQFIVCDSATNKVSLHKSCGEFIKYFGNAEITNETFCKPRYVCVSPVGDVIVSDSGNHKVKVFDSNGHFKRSFGGFGKDKKQFKYPYGVGTNNLGDIFVADHYNNRICMYNRDGTFIRHLVTSEQGLVHPQGIAISTDLFLYVTHGHLKANEILIFKLNTWVDSKDTDDHICHL